MGARSTTTARSIPYTPFRADHGDFGGYRMRNATILVLTVRGLATEVIKNIVLAGVGKLIMADNEDVKEEDLGTGFFFRDGDVGRKVRFSALDEFSLGVG